MNFSDLMKKAKEAPGFEVLPAGRYVVKVAKAEGVVTSTGKDSVKVETTVIAGPYANRKVFNQYTISPENANAIAFFLRHMQAFGISSDFLASEPGIHGLAAALVGRVVQFDVIIDNTYDGTDRNKVKGTYPPPMEFANGATPAGAGDPFRAPAAPAPAATPAPVAAPAVPKAPF